MGVTRDAEHRVGLTQWVAAVAAAASLLAIAAQTRVILLREPVRCADSLTWSMASFAAAAAGAVTILAISKRRWQAWLALVPITAFVAVGSVDANNLRWHWSRDEFTRAASGELACTRDRCEAGWWDLDQIEELRSTHVLWTRDEDCPVGLGYVRTPDSDDPVEAIRTELDASRIGASDASIRPWRDGWYEICVSVAG